MNKNNSISHDFVAIDIEYADSIQHICQLGLVVVRNLEIVDRRVWLMRPPGNRYDQNMIRVHGITPDMTAHAPSFEQAWPEIWECLKGEQLWAHNAASVEQPIINKNIRFCEQDFETIQWINDSCELYQRPGCNGGNGLVQCCMALGLTHEKHHDALADAEMCARIVIAAIEEQKPCWDDVPLTSEELHKAEQEKRILRLGEFRDYYTEHPSGEEDVFAVLSSTCDGAVEQEIDVFDKGDKMPGQNQGKVDVSRLDTSPENPLNGKTVVITGIFLVNREELKEAVRKMGGKPTGGITSKTYAVFVGTKNVGPNKLISIEEQESAGHHVFRVVGDDDLEALLYGDGRKFFTAGD